MSLINWYPGHIAKAQNTLKEQLKLIDFVLVLVDARLPEGSRFDVTNNLLGQKPRVLVFTKGDLALPERTQAWAQYYRNAGVPTVILNAQTGQGLQGLQKILQTEAQKIHAKMASRGRLPRPSRVMVVGLPNVGKSSLINKLAKKKTAKVGDKAGITKGVRWIKLGAALELMDTPGIIPPKLEDQHLALKLAVLGAVSDEAYDPILVAPEALKLLSIYSPNTLKDYAEPTVEGIARQRGFLNPGGGINVERTVRTILREIRAGQMGLVTLDLPPREGLPAEYAAAPEESPELPLISVEEV